MSSNIPKAGEHGTRYQSALILPNFVTLQAVTIAWTMESSRWCLDEREGKLMRVMVTLTWRMTMEE